MSWDDFPGFVRLRPRACQDCKLIHPHMGQRFNGELIGMWGLCCYNEAGFPRQHVSWPMSLTSSLSLAGALAAGSLPWVTA